MDTREIAEIASHLDGLDIPNLLWGQTAHLYHLGLRSSPVSGQRHPDIRGVLILMGDSVTDQELWK